MKLISRHLIGLLILGLFACTNQAPVVTPIPASYLQTLPVPMPSATLRVSATPTATRQMTVPSKPWYDRDVLPANISPRMLGVYQFGLQLGNDPHAFSKIGDGNASADWFLTDFDRGADSYNLAEYVRLQETINFFQGSFMRHSLSARRGFNTLLIFDPSRADKKLCQSGETPLVCELRVHKPAFALILMGTNQVWRAKEFEQGMRQTLDTLIEHGVVPVLSTKADNLEGDGHINALIVSLADEYQAPLWNAWAMFQGLPKHGLQADKEHITWAGNDFSNPTNMESAWAQRNLSALQLLDLLRLQVVEK